jgi:hypothetical protein
VNIISDVQFLHLILYLMDNSELNPPGAGFIQESTVYYLIDPLAALVFFSVVGISSITVSIYMYLLKFQIKMQT